MPANMLSVIFPTGKVALPPRLLGTLTDIWNAGENSSLRVPTLCQTYIRLSALAHKTCMSSGMNTVSNNCFYIKLVDLNM